MASTQSASTQLQPLPVTLSALHLHPEISALHDLSGIHVSLPDSETGATINFKAVLSESTTRNLLLSSFYYSNVRDKVFGSTKCVLQSLAEYGISRCAFTTTYGIVAGQPSLNDKTAPQFNVAGLSHVPFMYEGYYFSPAFLICDHIFCRQEYETQFVAVLSVDFLREYFIRAQYNQNGWRIQLPPHPPHTIGELLIYTDGCCLSNGLAARNPEAKPARGGYGIHFPTLPDGWDMYGALASSDKHTNQKAELIAVIRALQLVRLRNISCAKITIRTDSHYAVQGFNDWIPRLWRPNGYRSTKNSGVVNADLFRSLDEEGSLSKKRGIPVTLEHVLREDNGEADALSKLGAAIGGPAVNLINLIKGSDKGAEFEGKGKLSRATNGELKVEVDGGAGQNSRPKMLIGRNIFEEMQPLMQWTPDGLHWLEWQPVSGPGKSLSLNM